MATDRDTLLYPDVIAATKPGDIEVESTGHYFAEAVTNNMDTVVRTTVYWHGVDTSEPVLMIEIDDEDQGGPDPMDIRIRIRRNDGLIYEGTRASQEDIDEVPKRTMGDLYS